MKTALHSVSYAGVWPGQTVLSLEDFIDKAAGLGFDGVMLMAKRPHASPLDLDSRGRKKIRDLLNKRGLAIACLAGYDDLGMDINRPDVPVGEMHIAYITELAELARDLDANLIRIFTAFQSDEAPLTAYWDKCVRVIREAARRASEFGVTLGIQNHHDLAVHYESLYDLVQEINEENCRVMLDAWALVLHGDDPVAAIKKMAPYLVHTTVADYVRRPQFSYQTSLVNYRRKEDFIKAVPVGEGMIDYRSFLGALKDSGYQGFVAYEMCSPLVGGGGEENLDRCAGKFLDFMRSF